MIVTVIPVARAWPSAQEGVTENLRKYERLALVTCDLRTRRAAIQGFGFGINLVTARRRATECTRPAEGASESEESHVNSSATVGTEPAGT